MTRWLLVELESDLTRCRTTRTSVWRGIKLVAGVKSVTDMSSLSRRTMEAWLGDCILPAEQVLVDKSAQRRPRRNGAT